MDKELMKQCNRWHEEDEHLRIADAIERIPEENRDYDMKLMLCRALNNMEKYSEAYDMLLSIKTQGAEDYHWHFRFGYACYHLNNYEEAIDAFRYVTEKLPDDAEAWEYLSWCYEETGRSDLSKEADEMALELNGGVGAEEQNGLSALEIYEEDELNAVDEHIIEYFGEYSSVFHEIMSLDLHIDIAIIEPTEERNYYTLITMGMGAHKMDVPEALAGHGLERAELLIKLPADWDVQSSDEVYYWPIRWLKILARLPLEEESWLGWGHTVPAGNTLSEDTLMNGIILCGPMGYDEEARECELPNGETVNFYQVIPLYEEEMQFKLDSGAEELFRRFEAAQINEVVDVDRLNVCAEMCEKDFVIKTDSIKTLLTDWKGADGCITTDRIMVDGQKVGYMYREEPADPDMDSGWRFLAGDEDDEYLDKAENSGIYSLNTVCNYDEEIIPFLELPVGTKCIRNKKGKLVKLKK